MEESGVPEDCELVAQDGLLQVRVAGGCRSPVTVMYLRPLSSRSEIAVIDGEGQELFWVESIDELPARFRGIVASSLEMRYHLPKIKRVKSITTIFGTHYWVVETDKGLREFAFKEPGKNVSMLGSDRFALTDTIGNRYEISCFPDLDCHSQRLIETIL